MLFYIWLPLLCIRGFLSGYFESNTTLLTILINMIMFLDLLLDIRENNHEIDILLLCVFFLLPVVVLNKAELSFIDILLAVYLLRNVDTRSLLSFSVFCSFIMIALFLFCFLTGRKQNVYMHMPKGNAYTLGFKNANQASNFFYMYLLPVVELFLISNKKGKPFLLLPFFYLIFKLTLGRTMFYSELIFFILIMLLAVPFIQKISSPFICIAPVILYFVLFYLSRFFEKYPVLDIIFTTRFSIYSEMLSSMSIKNYLYGIHIPEGQPMDSSFLTLLFDGGILPVLSFLYMYVQYISYSLKKNDHSFFPFILCVLAAGFSENVFSSFNIISILFFSILYNRSTNTQL
jgi:hypothetical protein